MEYKILFTQQANKDLDCIKEYIYPCNEAAASDVVREIFKNIDMLRKMPSIGRAGRVLRTSRTDNPQLSIYRSLSGQG